MRWPEFAHLTGGLLSADTRLARYFRPPDPDKPNSGEPNPDEEV